MSQGNNFIPTTGVFSGLTAANDTNAALDALLTQNSGSSAPTNALGGVPKLGQTWLDTTSATLPVLKRYTGSAWVVEAVIDVANGIWIPVIGGGIGSVASAATTDLGIAPQAVQNVTGTVTITSFGSSVAIGTRKILIFGGVLTLTYDATALIIPGAANKVTAAGDVAEAIYFGSGHWRLLSYVPLVGTNVTSIAGNTGAFTLNEGLKNSTNKILVDPLYMRGYLSGLVLSTAGSSSTFGIAAGTAVDDAATGLMLLASAYTKTTSAWAVGSGNGALDTGSIAINTWYYVYLIKRTDTGVVDVLISLSATAPTMPASYTLSRYIGTMKTDGSSHWLAFVQVGNEILWLVPVADVSNVNLQGTNLAENVSVPPGKTVLARFNTSYTNSSATGAYLVHSPLITGQTVTVGNASGFVQTATETVYGTHSVLTSNGQIRAVGNAVGSANFYITTTGWRDDRGQ